MMTAGQRRVNKDDSGDETGGDEMNITEKEDMQQRRCYEALRRYPRLYHRADVESLGPRQRLA